MMIDRISQEEIHSTAQKLIADAESASSPYLMALIDHALIPESKLLKRWPGGRPVAFNLMSHLSADEHISHLLIPLPTEPEERLAAVAYLVKQCNSYPMFSLLASKLPPEVIADHLSTLTSVVLPLDSESYLLRFADTRIVPVLDRLLDLEQHDQLFGPFDQWAYIGRDGKAMLIKGKGLSDLPPAGPLELSEVQLEGFLSACMPDNFIPVLCENSSSFAKELPSLQYRLICHWTDIANEAAGGKAESAACLSYCLSCL